MWCVSWRRVIFCVIEAQASHLQIIEELEDRLSDRVDNVLTLVRVSLQANKLTVLGISFFFALYIASSGSHTL